MHILGIKKQKKAASAEAASDSRKRSPNEMSLRTSAQAGSQSPIILFLDKMGGKKWIDVVFHGISRWP